MKNLFTMIFGSILLLGLAAYASNKDEEEQESTENLVGEQ